MIELRCNESGPEWPQQTQPYHRIWWVSRSIVALAADFATEFYAHSGLDSFNSARH
ncbi:unnamed protein product [Protopolystoma xenopodis]|uniref:Uncharacterized protein n=1 Tax=Protopolystoma xenopodis TaxID=117903 RepID=A0A448XFB7_9PLAT|nr:unnamed protein product [Protopolystoma xenopodis]